MQRKSALCLAAAGVGAGLMARGLWRQRRENPLFGKVVLITGGASGLGLALARAFGAEGGRIAISAKDPSELQHAREDLESRGVPVFSARCDVTDCAQVDGLVGATIEHYGAIDILVNHTRQFHPGISDTVRLEDFQQTMEEMFWGLVYPTIGALPGMLDRRTGCVVNVVARGLIAGPHLVPYEAARSAAMGFSEGLRAELQTDGVTVITVQPSDSLSMDRAARLIVAAARGGDVERLLSSAVKILDGAHRMLPPNGNGHSGTRKGPLMSALTALGRMAAQRYLHP